MQKIQAGHLEGSVILLGSVGSSVAPLELSLLLSCLLLLPHPSPDESVQLLLRPERSAGSCLIVTARAEEEEEAAVCSLAFLLLLLLLAVIIDKLSTLRDDWLQADLILLLEPPLVAAGAGEEEGRRRFAAAAGLLIGSLMSGLVSTVTGFCSELVVELVELRRPNSGLRIFSTEKGRTLETC